MKKKLITCIVLLVFCLSLFNFSFAGDVTVSNPGFEEPVVNGVIPDWTQTFGTTGFSVTDAVKYGGNYSLKLVDNTTTSSIGLESSKINATAGYTYEATAMTYITSGSVLMYVRFWDSSNKLLTSVLASQNTPVNQWTFITAKGIAPAGTAKISLLLYSGMGATATAYIDNISMTASLIKFTNLGTQITNPITLGAAFGEEPDGKVVLYTVVSGNPAKLAVVDIKTESVIKLLDLPGAAGAWTVTVASDGAVYAGTYSNGHLYKYIPGSNSIANLGQAVPGDTYIWDLKPGPDGEVYGGTYIGGNVFKYDQSAGFTRLGGQVEPGEQYIRSVAYNPSTNILYSGVGAHAKLIKYDLNTGAKVNILPSEYDSEQFVYDMSEYEQDRPFGMLGVNTENKLFIGTVPTYGKLGGALSIYDFITGNLQVNRNIIQDQSIVSLTYKDGKVYGGTSVWGGLGITPTETEAKLFIWDVASGSKVFDMVPVAGKKAITALIEGLDGKIWGMAEGNLFKFDPATRTITYNTQIYPIDYSKLDHAWRDAFLEVDKDGNIYGVAGGKLFKVNPATMGVTTIRNNAYLLTQDDAGNMYFVDTVANSTLWRYEY